MVQSVGSRVASFRLKTVKALGYRFRVWDVCVHVYMYVYMYICMHVYTLGLCV